jgi:hypothetical protein
MKCSDIVQKHTNLITVHQWRLPLFSPHSQVAQADREYITREYITKHGKLKIHSSRLTQIHANIIQSIVTKCTKVFKMRDGCVVAYFRLNEILLAIGHKKTKNQNWLIQKIEEIANSNFAIETQNFVLKTRIIRKFGYTSVVDKECNLKKKIREYVVVFENEFCSLAEIDYVIAGKAINYILNIKDKFLQGFVRYVITHKKLNMKIRDVLKQLCLDVSERQNRRLINKIKRNKRMLEEDFNITIKKSKAGDECVFYSQHPDICILPPQRTRFNTEADTV